MVRRRPGGLTGRGLYEGDGHGGRKDESRVEYPSERYRLVDFREKRVRRTVAWSRGAGWCRLHLADLVRGAGSCKLKWKMFGRLDGMGKENASDVMNVQRYEEGFEGLMVRW